MAKKIKRELDCILTEEEKGQIGIKACQEHDRARELREEAAALEKLAKEKDHQVAQGKARRMVEVIEVKNFDQNVVRIERTDEQQYWPKDSPVVEERAMTGDERQMMITNVDGGKPDTDADDEEPEGDEPPKIVVVAPKKRAKKPKD